MWKKRILLFLAMLITVFFLLHSTPNIALRTNVFFLGYPIKAITTGIIDDKFHNNIDKEDYVKLDLKAYTLTKPPLEKNTGGYLSNYTVRKVGYLYFAKYLGDD